MPSQARQENCETRREENLRRGEVVGGNLTVSNSKFNKNTPGRWANFSHPGAKVTLKSVVLDGKKVPGTRTL